MTSNTLRILTLAIAGVMVGQVGSATAQYRVGDDGRALDASNRVGSGGRNDSGGPINNGPYQGNVSGNQIVTGNVTGGKEFRGRIDYADPTAFRGSVSGIQTDRFIRNSAGIADIRNPNYNLSDSRAFYGESTTVKPPAGFVQQRYTGAYVPAPQISNTDQADFRLDQPFDMPLMDTPQPAELILPGPVDSTNQQTLLTASPLYGVRPLRLGEQNDRSFLDNYTSLGQPDRSRRLGLSDQDIARMRDELNAESQGTTPPGESPANTGAQNLSLTNPVGQPADPAINARPLQGQAQRGAVTTGQGTRSRLMIPAAEQQSAQYAELQKRLKLKRDLMGNRPQSDVEAHNEFMEQVRLKEQIEKDAAAQKQQQLQDQEQEAPPRTPAEAAGIPDFRKMNEETLSQRQQGEDGATPKDLTPQSVDEATRKTQEAEAAARPTPLKIRSLADGVKARGLSDFLISAENLMKDGKFTSALEQYEAAEQVAPNNPLVLLGRANAELGASYYARAEGHLREAFMSDPALLMGQYDLREFLGQERLQFLVKDLKEIANTEKQQVRPVFLLAYIAYNTGNERQAAGYLELAEQRAGSTDTLFPLLREYWSLPTVPAEQNK